nr:hypothetical protein CFP56_74526 [Quercus suber]
METTGTGVGGSGGVRMGRVSETLLDTGHLVAFEQPAECAEASAVFIADELRRWEAEERERNKRWYSLSRPERVQMNDRWRHHLGISPKQGTLRPGKPGTKL